MLIGYARVSMQDQNLDLQQDALARAGCERVFEDKASGARDDRPGLAAALSHCRPGDVIVVYKLDRLGRTMRGLVELVADLAQRKIEFRSLSDGIVGIGCYKDNWYFARRHRSRSSGSTR